MLFEAHELKLDRDIREASRIIEDVGWSRFWLKDDFGVSVPAAVNLVCGARDTFLFEDFEDMLDEIPAAYQLRFCLIWDFLEAFGEQDLVLLNESFESKCEAVKFLDAAADLIEIG